MSKIEPEPLFIAARLSNSGVDKKAVVDTGESKHVVLDARLSRNGVKSANSNTTNTILTSWRNPLSDFCGAPGGCRIFAYVLFCPPCAAGDIAHETGRDWLISVIMYPLCGIWMAGDRQELANKFKIDDPLEGPAAHCFFCCGCSFCLLVQEYNEIMMRRKLAATGNKK